MGKYARQTSVSVAKSRVEVEHTLQKYGAKEFAFAFAPDSAAIQFTLERYQVRFVMPLPAYGKGPSEATIDQERRQRWRALALVIKAKLEAVECRVSTVEDEFLSYIVVPGGDTFGRIAIPQLQQARADGRMPRGLLEDHRKEEE
jgi:hypothetical protein